MIVKRPELSEMEAFFAFNRLIVAVSLDSSRSSASVEIMIVLDISPAAKVSLPDGAM